MTDTRTCNVCRREREVAAFARAFGVCEACFPETFADLMREIAIQRAADALASSAR